MRPTGVMTRKNATRALTYSRRTADPRARQFKIANHRKMEMKPTTTQTPAAPGAHVERDISLKTVRGLGRGGMVLIPALLALSLLTTACSGGSTPTSSSPGNAFITDGLNAEAAGQVQQAIKDFNSAVSANPASPVGYYDLGVVYQQRLNDETKAADEYNKSVLADPNYKPALYNLAILNTQSNPQQAIALYNQLLKINPNDPNVNFNLGLLLIAQGQAAQGHADLTKAIFLNPALKSRVPSGITP
jgi:Tfp pilus assembly protein PilF